ncbi:hypothetical protein [Sinisalibacter lacisalsi]|uniref:Uncharacterized protein n=1 Tax=Sinisalibacter lacisalsi TaxID=1526570 RepID=A0ABQ1QX54_9RHOB|nr:hypothetical protein [Sinisalibacter lacisalsi]GGD46604.1 hypothetical protein GCM10011358_32920 [Sinisalibacter lacisalsi]
MPIAAAIIAMLMVGAPATLLAAWLGWRGATAVWPVLVNALWPALGAAAYLAVTNPAEVPYRLDSPVASGVLLGGTLAALSAPLWLGGFWAGRRARQVRAG